jgi:pimeloyl-ACP methyl ester carboxylesterase
VTAPTTLIRGERGYVTDDDAEEFARRVPGASIVVVPAGHNVQEEIPLELGERLRTLATARGRS